MTKFKPLISWDYGPLDSKVNLEPDFFAGFDHTRRNEIVSEEAKFYHSITQEYSVDDKIDKHYVSVRARDGYGIPVKIYRKKNSTKKSPAMIFIHGGGFITCSPETHDFVPSYIAANAGVVCFNVDYRLAPEHKCPKGIEDCWDVAAWIRDRAGELNIDADELFICGDSSGGNYVAVITQMAKQSGDLHFKKQVMIYPATDFSGDIPKKSAQIYAMPGASQDADSGPSFLEQYLGEHGNTKDPRVSPLLCEDLKDLPKALFIQAECDGLCDDGLYYAHALKSAGVEVECEIYKGMPHAFILRTYEQSFEALERICSFLKY